MNQDPCSKCQHPLVWQGQYHCEHCVKDYIKVGFCPDCEAQLEKLQACGASNYFCNSCNELKSKSRVRFEYRATE
ncbi:zinc ribbon domain-containing protein [Vibrio taketomensis]|uniref:zinc ribbon domain-containing protein n=1 Tax=Vibrio taketomensis TaxID=2572923 RepID=UPI001389BC4F|nr:zinc ribbon domain-containing protein [Vibrio taketomensis]